LPIIFKPVIKTSTLCLWTVCCESVLLGCNSRSHLWMFLYSLAVISTLCSVKHLHGTWLGSYTEKFVCIKEVGIALMCWNANVGKLSQRQTDFRETTMAPKCVSGYIEYPCFLWWTGGALKELKKLKIPHVRHTQFSAEIDFDVRGRRMDVWQILTNSVQGLQSYRGRFSIDLRYRPVALWLGCCRTKINWLCQPPTEQRINSLHMNDFHGRCAFYKCRSIYNYLQPFHFYHTTASRCVSPTRSAALHSEY